MKKMFPRYVLLAMVIISCGDEKKKTFVKGLADLKRGELISCGPQDGEVFGTVSFTASVPEALKTDFNMAVALLHSFEYDEAQKMFAKVIDRAPECAMAYWGVAMSNFHSLWAPPGPAELQLGKQAVDLARSIKNKTKREADYIEAIGQFYDTYTEEAHRSRVLKFTKAMERLYLDYPDDREAAVFYALALNASADPKDKTYANQKKAMSILQPIFEQQPLHPGIAHYIIHNCDYPELAHLALPAARKYAAIASASAHAQHMPSHIFTRLGLWQENINSNLVSANAAKCYAEKAGIRGHWDEELHAMDYLVYSYLQKAKDDSAAQQVAYLRTIKEVYPLNFKTAYAFAAIPARYYLERKQWKDAANYQLHPVKYPWEKFSWQKGIFHFTRLLGNIKTGNKAGAAAELDSLNGLYRQLQSEKEKTREAAQVMVQIKTGEAWLSLLNKDPDKAVTIMMEAADLEDGMEKHPVTPGAVIPARELLGDMFHGLGKHHEALKAYEMVLLNSPNRLNALYGAGVSAKEKGEKQKALQYFQKLIEISGENKSSRKEVLQAKTYLRQLS